MLTTRYILDETHLKYYDEKLKSWASSQPVKTLPSTLYPWAQTAKAGAVTCWPVGGTPLLPTVDFLFTETPPASGDKSPTNPSTIAGVSSVKVTRCGKNLLKTPYVQSTTTVNDVTFTVNSDGTVTANGTASDVARFYMSYSSGGAIYKSGLTYTLSGCPAGGSGSTYYLGVVGPILNNTWYADVGSGKSFIPTSDGFLACAIVINSGFQATNLVFKPQLELASTATSFEPYAGTDYTLSLGSTYYGGTLDVASGVMTVTWVGKILTGLDNIGLYGTVGVDSRMVYALTYNGLPIPKNGSSYSVCSHSNHYLNNNTGVWGDYYVNYASNNVGYFVMQDKNNVIGTTVQAYKDWVDAQYNAGTPLTVVYEIATPYTVQLTPTQILSLSQSDKYTPRLNTVYTDAQSVQVGYVKSPIREEYELQQAIVGQGGEI